MSTSSKGKLSALLGLSGTGITLSATAPTRASVPLDAAKRDTSNKSPQLVAIVLRRLVLELRGVTYDGPPAVGFTLFASLGKNRKRLELGPLNLFGLRHGSHMHMSGGGQRFDIPALFEDTKTTASKLELSVEPFDPLAPGPKAAGAPPPRRAGGVKIAGFEVFVEAPKFGLADKLAVMCFRIRNSAQRRPIRHPMWAEPAIIFLVNGSLLSSRHKTGQTVCGPFPDIKKISRPSPPLR